MALPLVALVIIAICHGSFLGVASSSSKSNVNPVAVAVPVLSNAAKEFLEAHNKARAQVGVAPLKWSDHLADATSHFVRYQRVHKGCQFSNLAGANQAWGSGKPVTPSRAVVWRKSMELGCAQAFCVESGDTLTICFYNPPGNYAGESPY
ncbi:hypothetical protein EZV62_014124 [Acer yangbiense]|uniref:SCP domain-containing protein n=1 Tax=Acer yangbiense TaxID=1000413 RepID=A0A5C7HR76_9ROSI|nr:hypothetical protein EZV62_014124 [Acer yangbiense]